MGDEIAGEWGGVVNRMGWHSVWSFEGWDEREGNVFW